jgi:hypothetical protein
MTRHLPVDPRKFGSSANRVLGGCVFQPFPALAPLAEMLVAVTPQTATVQIEFGELAELREWRLFTGWPNMEVDKAPASYDLGATCSPL